MNQILSASLRSIHHDGSSRYVRLASGGESNLQVQDNVTIRLRAAKNAPIERVVARIVPDGEQQFVEMQREPDEPACRWWRIVIRLTMPVVNYRFLIFGPDGVWWYNGSGLHRHTPTDAEDFRLLSGYSPPSWINSSIFYQIFPDRFSIGDSDLHNNSSQDLCRWGESPSPSGRAAMMEFYGGDLRGIEKRLDYLLDLGVNALYLTPIFTAPSNHRYNIADYENVDPRLGGNAALVSLRRATFERGMRLILDIVPNHCGRTHPWFQAALADPSAPTAEYFTFYKHPDEYESWLGVRSLPKLNYRSTALRERIYAGPDAVFRRWLRAPYSIDGWRIDVSNMLARQGASQLGIEVLRGIRTAVKDENPDAYLMGENFQDPSEQLQGDCLDGVMNYAGFSIPVWHWVNGFEAHAAGQAGIIAAHVPWSTRALIGTWLAFRAGIPWTIAQQQYNLLGSHDTRRILSTVKGSSSLNRLSVGLLMTSVGVPSIYYGDEVGLRGEHDITARGCMPWERSEWDEDLLSFYQALIKLRRSSRALIEGGFQMLLIDDDSFAYLRDTDEEACVVVAHRGPGSRGARPIDVSIGAIPDGTEFVEVQTGSRLTVIDGCLPVPAQSPGIAIWHGHR